MPSHIDPVKRLEKLEAAAALVERENIVNQFTSELSALAEDLKIHHSSDLKVRDALVIIKEARNRIASLWNNGTPPPEIEVAWLLLEVAEGIRAVRLGVFDDDGTWSEAGDWKGESYGNVIDCPIVGWQSFELPKPPKRV